MAQELRGKEKRRIRVVVAEIGSGEKYWSKYRDEWACQSGHKGKLD
jgi:hypothetical protein